MKDYYLLIGLNQKDVKIISIEKNGKGVIAVEIENKNKKVKCPICKKFTSWIYLQTPKQKEEINSSF